MPPTTTHVITTQHTAFYAPPAAHVGQSLGWGGNWPQGHPQSAAAVQQGYHQRWSDYTQQQAQAWQAHAQQYAQQYAQTLQANAESAAQQYAQSMQEHAQAVAQQYAQRASSYGSMMLEGENMAAQLPSKGAIVGLAIGSVMIVLGSVLISLLAFVFGEFDTLLKEAGDGASKLQKNARILLATSIAAASLIVIVGIVLIVVAKKGKGASSAMAEVEEAGGAEAELMEAKEGGGALLFIVGGWFVGSFSFVLHELYGVKKEAAKQGKGNDKDTKAAEDILIVLITLGCLMFLVGIAGVVPE